MGVTVTDIVDGPYIPNGVTTTFAFGFKAVTAAEVVVYRGEDRDIVSSALYSVALDGDGEGGSVVFTTAPATGSGDLIITAEPSFAQVTNFTNSGFLPGALNPVHERMAMRDLYLRALLDRSFKLPLGDVAGALPSLADLAGKFFAFDIAGNPIASAGTGADAGLRADLAAQFGTSLISVLMAPDATPRQLQAKLRESLVLTPQDFGVEPDWVYNPGTNLYEGGTDYSDEMLLFYTTVIDGGYRAFIPGSEFGYGVRFGVLDFWNGHETKAWPVIETGGHLSTTFVGLGTANAPMLTISNEFPVGATPVADDMVWRGGLHGGITVFDNGEAPAATGRHMLSMMGAQNIKFGQFNGFRLRGHGLFLPKQIVPRAGGGENPDPHHVYDCVWDGIQVAASWGYAVYNLNANGLVANSLGAVRSSISGGGIYGVGADNIALSLTTGTTSGYVLHDGSDVVLLHGSPFGFTILSLCEIDDPRRVFYMSRSKFTRIQARIISRYNNPDRLGIADGFGAAYAVEGTWPLNLGDIGSGPVADADSNHLDLYVRIDGPDPGKMFRPNVSFNYNSVAQPDRHSFISIFMQDNVVYGFRDTEFYAGINPSLPPKVKITKDGKTVFDQISRSFMSASCTGNLLVQSAGYPAASTILPFNSLRWDRGNDAELDVTYSCWGFKPNRVGDCEFTIRVPLNIAVGTLVRFGIMTREGAPGAYAYNFTSASGRQYQVVAGDQAYVYSLKMQVVAGALYMPVGAQATGAPVSAAAEYLNEPQIQFQAEMVE